MTSPCIYPCERCGITITAWSDENPLCQKCDMIKENKKMFRETHPHSDAEYQLGRPLENAIHTTHGKCSDCGKMSKFLIIEKEGIDPCPEAYLNAWYWCGMCLVG